MNTSTASQSFDDLEGMLRMAVEQIASAPLPAGAAEQIVERAAKWEEGTVRTPAKRKTGLYLAAGMALALVVLVAVTIAMVGGLPGGKPAAVPSLVEKIAPKNKTEPQENPANAAAGISPAYGTAGAPPPPAGTASDMRLGMQPGAGLGANGGFGAGGGVPSKQGGATAAKEEQAGKNDQERMVGNWFIVNDDSKRKGEMWVISEDRILMYAKHGGANAILHLHRLDAGKDPKQIDITVTRVKGPTVGVIKGIYALDGDELRLCLAALGKDRPAAFPQKPGPGEVLILQRNPLGTSPPQAKKERPAQSDQERMVGNWFIVNDDSKRKGEMWVISEDRILMNPQFGGAIANLYLHRLDAGQDPKQIDITVTRVKGPTVGVIKGIYILDGDELRLCLGEMGKDRPAAFPQKPRPGEVLILQRVTPSGGGRKAKEEPPAAQKEQKESQEKPAQDEKLRVLIDKVLEAHGGEDKLSKLQFTMTVKHSNGETQHYFVQPPKNFRWETTHRDRTGKRIVILFPEGRRWWTKEPGEAAREFIPTGAEPRIEYWLDYVNLFGPRQVLRLKDADHKATLLDEEAKIGDRAAVGVQVTGPHCNRKMYFDKETHLLLKGPSAEFREATFSDYKTYGGIPIAQKEHDGHFEPEITDFQVVDKFDAKLFEQP